MYAFRNATHEERLLTYLFNDYEPVARAVMDTNQTVTVTIDFVLLRIHGLVSQWITMMYRLSTDTAVRPMNFRRPIVTLSCFSKRRLASAVSHSDVGTDCTLLRFRDTAGPQNECVQRHSGVIDHRK